jgi:hypothetical protein
LPERGCRRGDVVASKLAKRRVPPATLPGFQNCPYDVLR